MNTQNWKLALKAAFLLLVAMAEPLYTMSAALATAAFSLILAAGRAAKIAHDIALAVLIAFTLWAFGKSKPERYTDPLFVCLTAAMLWYVCRIPDINSGGSRQNAAACTDDGKSGYRIAPQSDNIKDAEFWDPETNQWRLPEPNTGKLPPAVAGQIETERRKS